MRLGKLALAAAVASLSVSSFVAAASVDFGGYAGPITITYGNFDMGKIYGPISTPVLPAAAGAAAVDAADPVQAGTTLAGAFGAAEDFWGVAQVTAIYAGVDTSFPLIYLRNGPAALQGSLELMGIFYGGVDIQVETVGTNQRVRGAGMELAIFADDSGSPDWANLGPASRTNPGGIPSYPDLTDGTPILTFVSVPGVSAANPFAEFETTIDPTLIAAPVGTFVGSGAVFLDTAPTLFGVGTQNSAIQEVAAGPEATVQFTVRSGLGSGGWTVRSNDPLLTTVIPLPSAAYMGAIGLAGLAFGAWRRRHRAA
jgi:hypothetical protein